MLDHLRSLPAGAVGLAGALTRRGPDNAAAALEAIRGDISDRSSLAPAPDDGTPHEAGALVRLTAADCLRLLRSRHVGRLAYVARTDTPDVVPVTYTVGPEGHILIRSGPGPKLGAARRRGRVAFEVDDIDESTRTGWSVVVAGWADAPAEGPASASAGVWPWAAGPREHLIRITPDRIEGRRLS